MAIAVHDYLIEQSGIDWPAALSEWDWLLPPSFEVWLVNRLADLILVLPDGSVHLLAIGSGTLTKGADSREHFRARIDEDNNANEWLAIPLVDEFVAAGLSLQPGQCYGFKMPPILGGDYTVENCAVMSVCEYLGACGSIHGQLRDVPDGTQIALKVTSDPDAPGTSSEHDSK